MGAPNLEKKPCIVEYRIEGIEERSGRVLKVRSRGPWFQYTKGTMLCL